MDETFPLRFRERATGSEFSGRILSAPFSRHIPKRAELLGRAGDYLLLDAKGDLWPIRALNLPALFEEIL